MTSSVHHLVADLAARLDVIEKSLWEDYEAYAAVNADSLQHGGASSSDPTILSPNSEHNQSRRPSQKGISPNSPVHPTFRLNLSQRLASIHSTYSKSLIAGTASEISDRLQFISSALLPSYISSEVVYEPDRLVDSEALAQRYAVIKRRLNTEAQKEFDQLKLNMKALTSSTFAKDGTGAVIADVLAYNGPNNTPADGSEVIQGAVASTNKSAVSETDIRDWVNRAAVNNSRAQELHLRLAKAKVRYESLVNYANKQMCVWDLQIEELEKRSRRQTAKR